MKRATIILLLVLIAQCGLLALSYWPGSHSGGETRTHVLAPFQPGQVDQLTVGDAYDNEVVLTKTGERWTIPELQNLPADASRVEAVLAALTTDSPGWPVARTESAHRRFQVTSSSYQRRLSLASMEESLATFYLGTSPGFAKVHARNASQDTVFSISFSNFDAPAVAGHWLDPKLLQIRAPLSIDAELYTLRFDNGVWISGTGGRPDATELQILLSTLKTLEIEGTADEQQLETLADVEPDLILDIQSLAGEVRFELMSTKASQFIRSSEYPLLFRIGEPVYQRLTGVDIGLIAGESNAE